MAAPATARELIAAGEARLAAVGIDTPRLDAELLLAAAAGVTRSEIVAGLADPSDAIETYEAWLERRAEREPLAYITGRQGFRRIDLSVDPRVLIPRPETELLVAVVKVDRPCGILDVATGSGAVALALADELPDATISATDISPGALEVARANAQALGAAVNFLESDLLEAVDGIFDAIAANLPYVEAEDINELQPEVSKFEPRLALDGGPDGLDLVRRLAAAAPAHLRPGGMLALEIGEGQAAETERILQAAGFVETERHEDLNGIERVVSGRTTR
ncbi:MAG: peptide chain release factor N(5)-glutamine methyltransferase [Thermoleophilaceae bacterium]|nr:peptide chain release factor N(5)-glutamine methyltransferase [Thermoleophilaceae bacterium]